MAEKKEEESEVPEIPKRGPSGIIIIVIINLLAVVGLGAFMLLKDKSSKEHVEGGESKSASAATASAPGSRKDSGPIMSLSNFLVNLDDRETSRFVRLGIALELTNPDKKAADKMKEKEPLIRDVIISQVSSLSFQEVRSTQGKQTLRDTLLAKFNEVLGSNQVRSVYFTEFIIQ